LARRDAWRYKSEKLRQDFLGEMLERRKNYQIYFLINIIFQMFLLITLFWNDRLARRLRHSRTTEKKQGALLARYEARVRSLPARLIDVQEKERVKIGRLVHDEIGHLLTAIKIHLHLIRKKLATSQPAIDELIVEASSTIDQTNELLKGILEEIRPVFLDRFGFSEAIKLQVGKFSLVSKLPCTVVINVDNEKDISKSIATGMFRIVQESLTNVLKHADAEKVVVRVDRRNENLVLRVFDDGTGIRNEDLEKKESFGILGMQERIYFFNGKFKIGSLRHIKGTFLKAVVPITGEMECV
jgi:signal transduction histidine kinase